MKYTTKVYRALLRLGTSVKLARQYLEWGRYYHIIEAFAFVDVAPEKCAKALLEII